MPARKTYLFYLDIYLLLKIELLVWTGLLQWASRWQCPRISKHSSVPECHVPHGAGEVTLRLPLGTAIYARKKRQACHRPRGPTHLAAAVISFSVK